MFWMRIKARTTVLILLLAAGSAAVCWSKCADVVIRAHGDLVGELSPDFKLTMEICPKPKRPLPVVTVTRHHFEMEAYFDGFIAENTRSHEEYCGRTPETIVLVLMDGSKELARTKLDFEKDFTQDENGHYAVREALTVQIPSH